MDATTTDQSTIGVQAGLGFDASLTSVTNSQEDIEPFKCYVVGTAFAAGSGYPETWQDQPYSTGY